MNSRGGAQVFPRGDHKLPASADQLAGLSMLFLRAPCVALTILAPNLFRNRLLLPDLPALPGLA